MSPFCERNPRRLVGGDRSAHHRRAGIHTDLLTEIVAEMNAEFRRAAWTHDPGEFTAEIADLKTALAESGRSGLNSVSRWPTDKTQPLDLPALPRVRWAELICSAPITFDFLR